MRDFIDSYCNCDIYSEEKSKHIAKVHAHDILKNTLQPVFKKQVQIHPTLSRRPKPKYRAAHESELHENQQWKQNDNVSILFWLIEELPSKDLEENLHLIIPPVLIVLDDYDIVYIKNGVKMVHIIIKKLDPKYISKYGLDNVFFESIFRCLLYLSQERDAPLLKEAYPCILDLISLTKHDRDRSDLYERVLADGVLTGYAHAGQKIKFLPILLEPISTLYNELGAVGVQYLKAIIPILCDSMAMISSNNSTIKEINQLAADSLSTVMRKCWPRIPTYKGPILKALVKSWSYYYGVNDGAMCDKLRQVYKLLEAACQGKEKADKEALLSYNRQLYERLFSSDV